MNFFKTFLASLLAFLVANILIFIFAVMIFAGIVATFSNKQTKVTSPNSVLVIDLSNGVVDAPDASPFKSFGLGGVVMNKSNSIFEVLSAVEKAELDKNIKGVYIRVTDGAISIANIEELRGALAKFSERSGKFIVAYADSYSQAGYYLSSVADKVFLNPQGSVVWHGLSAQVMFYKGLLDKLGVKVEIIRHGAFKSAVEPFMLDRMSTESRTQFNTVLGSIWEDMMLADVSLSREIDADALSFYANELRVRDARSAVELGLVDELFYEDQVIDLLGRLIEWGPGSYETSLQSVLRADSVRGPYTGARLYRQNDQKEQNPDVQEAQKHETVVENIPSEKVNLQRAEEEFVATEPMKRQAARGTKPNMIKLSDYIATLSLKSLATVSGRPDKIAIVYIDGDIVDGVGVQGSAGGATISEKLSKVRLDPKVKGVVVRVNSPGGSALASEVMWREMELLRCTKPVVVSMGGYAASGGYYVSAPADVIVANRSTLTGSIGVFGLMVNIENTLRDKLGITVDVAKTNDHADMGSIFRPLKDSEKQLLMQNIEHTYKTFIGHVAAGRNMTTEQVDVIGGGRVWSGANAVEIGLADYTGGLQDAITICARNAGLADKEYKVTEMVDTPDAFSMLLRMFSSSEMKVRQNEMGEAFIYYNTLVKMLEQQGVQARMPYIVEIK